MKCLRCGAENPDGKRYCSMCGEAIESDAAGDELGTRRGQFQQRVARYPEPWPRMMAGSGEEHISRILGGVAWLIVSVGTFMIAFGWLGMIDASYREDPIGYLRIIGYGVLTYGIAAILLAIRAFVRPAH